MPEEPTPTPVEIEQIKAQAEAQQKAANAKAAELVQIAEDATRPDVDRVLAALKLLAMQVAANSGGGLKDIIKTVTPRLEAFGGNFRQMGEDIATLKGQVANIERGVYALTQRK